MRPVMKTWSVPSIYAREFRLKIAPGDTIGTRDSDGQDPGYVPCTSDTPTARLATHRTFEQAFEIIME